MGRRRRILSNLKLLTTVGFSKYINSEQLIKSFFEEKPHQTLDETIFRQSIRASAFPGGAG
jgi:hypothetical protein